MWALSTFDTWPHNEIKKNTHPKYDTVLQITSVALVFGGRLHLHLHASVGLVCDALRPLQCAFKLRNLVLLLQDLLIRK